MPDMTPVAQNVNVDPNAGFSTLSKVLGLQQKRQALQIQAQQVQQQELATQKQSAYQGFFSNFDPFDHLGPDGTTDTDSVKSSPGYAKAGAARDLIDEKLLNIKQQQLQNKSSLLGLNKDQLGIAAQVVGPLADDPEVKSGSPEGREKLKQTIAGLSQQFGPGAAGMAQTFVPLIDKAKPGDLAKAVRGFQLQAQDTAKQLEIQKPGGAIVQGNNSQYIANTNPYAPVPVGSKVGQSMQQGLSPTQQPGYVAATAAATASGGGGAKDDVERVNQVSSSVAPSRQAITLSDQISKLADEVHTGKFSKTVADLAAAAGIDGPTAARQLISKYAAQLKTVASAHAPSDEARSGIDAGYPDPDTMGPTALKGAAEFIKGNMLMNLSRAANQRKYQDKFGSAQGFRYADDKFTQDADPLMYTYEHLPKGAERQDFVRRHFSSAQDAADFVRRKNAIEHNGGFDQ